MRNPSAYVSFFLNAQICCILLFLPKFSISNFRTGVRVTESTQGGGVANFTGVAASGGGVHPWVPGKFSNEIISEVIALNPKMYSVMTKNFYPIVKILIIAPHLVSSVILSLQRDHQNSLKKDPSRRL